MARKKPIPMAGQIKSYARQGKYREPHQGVVRLRDIRGEVVEVGGFAAGPMERGCDQGPVMVEDLEDQYSARVVDMLAGPKRGRRTKYPMTSK